MSFKMLVASTVAVALAAGGPAYAAKSPSEPLSDGGAAKGKGERKICRSFENTASRMKAEKLCMTREQWRKFDAKQ